jgi:phosphotransferase system IIB component
MKGNRFVKMRQPGTALILGAMGGVKRGNSGLQVIVGTRAEMIAGEIRE